MAASLSKSMRLSSLLKMDREDMITRRQGIVSILGSDSERTKGASFRRTLSADMSSKKWLVQNGFSPMKKIASSEEFPILLEEEDQSCRGEELERPGQFVIWSSIQEEQKKKELQKAKDLDIWSSILFQKEKNDSLTSLPPYIHPLVKSSRSSLSAMSLEICTERLGSETDSDMVSSYPPSEAGDQDETKGEQEQDNMSQHFNMEEEEPIAKYSCSHYSKKSSSPRSFPPPLPFLSRGNGSSVYMQTQRGNGRLVLEAVEVASQKNFIAERQDGRLLLTIVDIPTLQELEEEEMVENEVEKDVFDEEFLILEPDEAGEEKKVEDNEDENMTKNSLIRLLNGNPKWPNKLSEVVSIEEEEEDAGSQLVMLSQSLPPLARLIAPPSAVAGASLNDYENCWRRMPLKEASTSMEGENKTEYLAPFLRGCKEPRRSLFFWEPHCIATS